MKRLAVAALVMLFCAPSLSIFADDASAPTSSSRASPAIFINVTSQVGLGGVVGDSYAWGDYNNDGYDDLLVKGNRLFKNNGPPTYSFADVTAAVGIGGGYGYAVWGDYNNDGYLDFFCAGQDETKRDTLWRNNGPPRYDFTNASTEAGGMDDHQSPSIAAAWVDYDRDSYLDIYVVNWRIGAAPNFEDCLWHNNGDGTFTNVTRTVGIVDYGVGGVNPPYAGMGVDCADYNNDGWPDIYVGNYLLMPNYLWHNNHNGTFTDYGSSAYANVSGTPKMYSDGSGPYYGHTAGSCWGDYNNDGLLDLWVGNLAHKDTDRARICDNPMLMKNLGFPYKFEDYKERAGMPNIPNGMTVQNETGALLWRDDDTFGGAWCDFDNDGWLDLYVPEVKDYYDAKVHWSYSHLWHNNGDGTFTDVGNDAGIRVWQSIGCAWADYNNDGQPDEVTEGQYPYGGPREVHLFQNAGTTNHWLKVKLNGTVSNRAAIGARVTVSTGAMTQIREVEGATGGHSHQNSLTQMFGLGSYSGKVSVEVRWPSGIIQNITGVSLNQTMQITEDKKGADIMFVTPTKTVLAEGENVTIKYGFGWGDDTSFTAAWDFEGDGKFDVLQNPPGANPVVYYDKPGRYYPKLRVMNTAGTRGCEESAIIDVHDVPPVSRAGGDIVANESDTITLNGGGSTGAWNDIPNFTYRWTFSDGCITGWQKSPQTARTFDQKAVLTATLGVKDDEGSISNDTINITVRNVPPYVTIDPTAMALEDSPLELNGSGHDTEADIRFLQYQWDFGDGTVSPWYLTPKQTHTYVTSGNFTARLTVKDDDGDKGTGSIRVTVADVPPSGVLELESLATDEDSSITLTGTGLDTPSDLGTLTYRWDFGDGNSTEWGPERSATHTYTANGSYMAMFFVRDHSGATAISFCIVTVRNLAPTCTISTPEQEISEDSEIEFAGAGKDTPTDLPMLQYQWDFGDGNGTNWSGETAFVHSYAQEGEFTATLTVRDDDGGRGKASITITVSNLPPGARAKASKTSVDEDTKVIFNASDSTDTPSDLPLLSYSWDFGDGTVAEGITASHGYSKEKTYKATLTVTDDDGARSTAEVSIKVGNPPPNIQASASTLSIEEGKTVSFSASGYDTPSDNASLRFDWDFGDHSTGAGRNATHAYSAEGRYTVTAKVTDDEGASALTTLSVEVTAAPAPPAAASGPPIIVYAAVGGVIAAIAVVAFLVVLLRSKKGKNGRTPPDSARVPAPAPEAMAPPMPQAAQQPLIKPPERPGT